MARIKKDGKWYNLHITNSQTFEYELIEDKDYVEPQEIVIKNVIESNVFDSIIGDKCNNTVMNYSLGDLE